MIGSKSGFLFSSQHIVALPTLMLKLDILWGEITERNDGGGRHKDAGVLDNVTEGG